MLVRMPKLRLAAVVGFAAFDVLPHGSAGLVTRLNGLDGPADGVAVHQGLLKGLFDRRGIGWTRVGAGGEEDLPLHVESNLADAGCEGLGWERARREETGDREENEDHNSNA